MRQVDLIGIDANTQGQVSDFGRYLQHPENRRQLSFDLTQRRLRRTRPPGRARGRPAPPDAQRRLGASPPGGRGRANGCRRWQAWTAAGAARPPGRTPDGDRAATRSLPPAGRPRESTFDIGQAAADRGRFWASPGRFPRADGEERFVLLPGDDVQLIFPTAPVGDKLPSACIQPYTMVDFYECKMSEYDSKFVFVPIESTPGDRQMIDPATGKGMFNSIQIKLKPGRRRRQGPRQACRPPFPGNCTSCRRGATSKGPCWPPSQMESAILNVLLFLIIAVSGFGILAIFFMIVVEKTRDIGILKSLGASARA